MKNFKLLIILIVVFTLCIGKSHAQVNKIQQGNSWITAVKVLPNSKSLVASSLNGTVVNWDLHTGKPIWKVDFDEKSRTSNSYTVSRINDLSISFSGKILAVSYSQSTVIDNTAQADDVDRIAILDIRNGAVIKIVATSKSIGKIMFQPNEDLMLACIDENVNLLNPTTGEKSFQIKVKGGCAFLAFSPDGNQFAVAMGPIWETPAPPIVGLYETKTGKLIREFPRQYTEATGISFSPDGKNLVIGGFNMPNVTTKIWNLALPNSQEAKIILDKDNRLVRNYVFSPNGKLIAYSMSKRGQSVILVRDLLSNKLIKTYKTDYEAQSICISPSGTTLAVGNRKGEIVIFSLPK